MLRNLRKVLSCIDSSFNTLDQEANIVIRANYCDQAERALVVGVRACSAFASFVSIMLTCT